MCIYILPVRPKQIYVPESARRGSDITVFFQTSLCFNRGLWVVDERWGRCICHRRPVLYAQNVILQNGEQGPGKSNIVESLRKRFGKTICFFEHEIQVVCPEKRTYTILLKGWHVTSKVNLDGRVCPTGTPTSPCLGEPYRFTHRTDYDIIDD